MQRILAAAILALITASPAIAGSDIEDFQSAQAGAYRDSGIGSYSNVYGHGWTKVCCDYPYYHPSRGHHGRRRGR